MASLNDLMRLFTLFLSLSLHSASLAPAPAPSLKLPSNNLLESTCKKTREFYTLCMETLESNPETATASSPLDLAEAALKFAAEDTKIASKKLRALLKSKFTQPGLNKGFEICVNWYDMAARQLNMSSQELEDPLSANYDAALANSHESADCENALASAGVHVPEIEAMIKRLRCFCRIAYVVTDALPQEY
ncbi:hypothetical protein ACOSP7_009503 [Xanthoceras sorbifolium]|uniref:Pectinesterase inhibitor domain-containing protein n=1 Tax=Xanthoceras sorbifolium TaxID=99658 RepID=A0ABQ8GZH6_9ROSI|nr:hypothetical protein JRO89_XSUnG0094000 [Xanthoceras sorbifolium]